jgi:hypothetical protein
MQAFCFASESIIIPEVLRFVNFLNSLFKNFFHGFINRKKGRKYD